MWLLPLRLTLSCTILAVVLLLLQLADLGRHPCQPSPQLRIFNPKRLNSASDPQLVEARAGAK